MAVPVFEPGYYAVDSFNQNTGSDSYVNKPACFYTFQLKLDSADSEPLIVEDGDSVKIHVSFTVPESHKFDPVAVEFGFAFEKIGNEDRNFLLQGTTDLVLAFVNKGIFKETCLAWLHLKCSCVKDVTIRKVYL